MRATCPVTGKTFDVRWADLVHWRVDARAVATLVRRSLCLGGDVSMIEHDRVYRLGARGGGDEINEEFYLLIGPNDERVRQLLDTIVKASHDTSAIVVFSHFKSRRIRSPDRALVARSLQDVLVEQLSAGPLIAKTPATRDSGETGAIEPPPGTRWRDVRIRIGEDGLLVAIGDQRWWRTWEAAGFADMRGGTSRHQPTALWLLLRRFARGGSVPIPTSRDRAPRDADTELRREVDALKNQVARLRRLLVALIPVDDPETDPIIARTSQASPLKRPAPRSPKHSGAVIGNEYATSFAIVEQRGPVVLMPSGRGWSDVAIRLVDDDSFEISVPRSSADHVATDTPAGRRTEIIGFDELSEDDATGRDAVAAVLRRILRSDRSATKLGDRDAAFLALRRRLGAVLDLDPRGCLKFDREAQAWLPGFKVVTSDAASA